MAVGIIGDNHAAFEGSYFAFSELYRKLKSIKLASQENRIIEGIDFIVTLGDYVGGHIKEGKINEELEEIREDEYKFTDPHEWVKLVNFIRVRTTGKPHPLSQPTDDFKSYIKEKYNAKEIDDSALERILDDNYVGEQEELWMPLQNTPQTRSIRLSYREAENEHIPILALLGNHDIAFVRYYLTGNIPEEPKGSSLSKSCSRLIMSQVDYSFGGYDKSIFSKLINKIAQQGRGIDQTTIDDELKLILKSQGFNRCELSDDPAYQRLRETIPAVAFLYGLYASKIQVKGHPSWRLFNLADTVRRDEDGKQLLSDCIEKLESLDKFTKHTQLVTNLKEVLTTLTSGPGEGDINKAYSALEELSPHMISALYEPNKEYVYAPGRKIKIMCAHSLPIGRNVYSDHSGEKGHKAPKEIFDGLKFPDGVNPNAVAVGHNHQDSAYLINYDDPSTKKTRDILFTTPGVSGKESREQDPANMTPRADILYDCPSYRAITQVRGSS